MCFSDPYKTPALHRGAKRWCSRSFSILPVPLKQKRICSAATYKKKEVEKTPKAASSPCDPECLGLQSIERQFYEGAQVDNVNQHTSAIHLVLWDTHYTMVELRLHGMHTASTEKSLVWGKCTTICRRDCARRLTAGSFLKRRAGKGLDRPLHLQCYNRNSSLSGILLAG